MWPHDRTGAVAWLMMLLIWQVPMYFFPRGGAWPGTATWRNWRNWLAVASIIACDVVATVAIREPGLNASGLWAGPLAFAGTAAALFIRTWMHSREPRLKWLAETEVGMLAVFALAAAAAAANGDWVAAPFPIWNKLDLAPVLLYGNAALLLFTTSNNVIRGILVRCHVASPAVPKTPSPAAAPNAAYPAARSKVADRRPRSCRPLGRAPTII